MTPLEQLYSLGGRQGQAAVDHQQADAGPLHPLHRCVWRQRHGDHVPSHPARLHGGLQRLQRQSHQPVLLREEPPHGTAGGAWLPAAEHAG